MTLNIDTLLENLFWGGPYKIGDGLPPPVEKPNQAAPKVDLSDKVKYTTGGIAYKEIKPEGNEVTAWQIVTTDQAKGSAVLDNDEHAAARELGFAVDTIVKVKRLWAEGLKQSQIAKQAGVSLATVKRLTPVFSKKRNKKV